MSRHDSKHFDLTFKSQHRCSNNNHWVSFSSKRKPCQGTVKWSGCWNLDLKKERKKKQNYNDWLHLCPLLETFVRITSVGQLIWQTLGASQHTYKKYIHRQAYFQFLQLTLPNHSILKTFFKMINHTLSERCF